MARKTRKKSKIDKKHFPEESQCHPKIKHKDGGCLPEEIYQIAGKRLNLSIAGETPSKSRVQTGAGKKGTSRSKKSKTPTPMKVGVQTPTPMKVGVQTFTQKTKKEELVKQLYNKLGVKEGNERSLLNKLPFTQEEKDKVAKEYLRPEMPSSWSNDLYSESNWLDSTNIRDVMKQYEEAYPHFKFLGPFPIDFAAPNPYRKGVSQKNLDYKNPPPPVIGAPDPKKAGQCLIDDMCALDLKKEAANGKTGIGIIYNLDPHYKDGSHWMASYIDIPKKEFYFFDSYGMRPPRPIYKFMQWLTIQEPQITLGWNGRRFQKRDSECGMYCLYFLAKMISGQPFLEFVRSDPPDRLMLDLRDWMYST